MLLWGYTYTCKHFYEEEWVLSITGFLKETLLQVVQVHVLQRNEPIKKMYVCVCIYVYGNDIFY